MGAGSLKGCNVCDFGGVNCGETIKYPSYARYTSLNDTRRLRRPTGCVNSNVMWNIEILLIHVLVIVLTMNILLTV